MACCHCLACFFIWIITGLPFMALVHPEYHWYIVAFLPIHTFLLVVAYGFYWCAQQCEKGEYCRLSKEIAFCFVFTLEAVTCCVAFELGIIPNSILPDRSHTSVILYCILGGHLLIYTIFILLGKCIHDHCPSCCDNSRQREDEYRQSIVIAPPPGNIQSSAEYQPPQTGHVQMPADNQSYVTLDTESQLGIYQTIGTTVDALSPDEDTYKFIKNRFDSETSNKFAIDQILQIDNCRLRTHYTVEANAIQGELPPTYTLQSQLWHGTAPEATDNINSHGFNRNYRGKNGTAYGQGVYFAQNASYSECYSKAGADGYRYMYLTDVLHGRYAPGKSSYLEPPKLPWDPTKRYHSVVDNVNNPTIFVIFHDNRSYPAYLVKFK